MAGTGLHSPTFGNATATRLLYATSAYRCLFHPSPWCGSIVLFDAVCSSAEQRPIVMRSSFSLVTGSLLLSLASASPWPFRLRAAPLIAESAESSPMKERRQLTVRYSNISEATPVSTSHAPPVPPAQQSIHMFTPIPAPPPTSRVCSTTLYPLAASPIPITACEQTVTYSADHGYRFVSTGTNHIENLTTYWEAPWDALKVGEVPSDGATRVCSEGGCEGPTPTATTASSSSATDSSNESVTQYQEPMTTSPNEEDRSESEIESGPMSSSSSTSTISLTSTTTYTLTVISATSTSDSSSSSVPSAGFSITSPASALPPSSSSSTLSASSNLDLGLGLGLG